MKIKQIRRTAPELYLVTYQTRWFKRGVERWVIKCQKEKKIGGCTITDWHPPVFYFRDNDELAHDCWHQIEWMIRNDVDFFDNFPEPWDGKSFPCPDLIINKKSEIHDPYPNVNLTGAPK